MENIRYCDKFHCIASSYPYGPYAIKWKNLQIQNLDPDPKFDSIKIFTQKNVKKFDL